jgi:hypothetical protein
MILLKDRFIYSKLDLALKAGAVTQIYEDYEVQPEEHLVHLDDVHLLLFYHEPNIGHFFYDSFFNFYANWRLNKRKVLVSIPKNQKVWFDFISGVIDKEFLVFADVSKFIYMFSKLETFPDQIYFEKLQKNGDETILEVRNIRNVSNYKSICIEIKNKCFSHYSIKENRHKKILYGRNDLARKKLQEIDFNYLEINKIEYVLLASMDFKDILSLMAETKFFAYIVGAGSFYLLFLDDQTQAVEINPIQNHSWALSFGLADLCKFNLYIATNTQPSEDPRMGILDSNIIFDDALKTTISELLLDVK